jgi:hypothetical protein
MNPLESVVLPDTRVLDAEHNLEGASLGSRDAASDYVLLSPCRDPPPCRSQRVEFDASFEFKVKRRHCVATSRCWPWMPGVFSLRWEIVCLLFLGSSPSGKIDFADCLVLTAAAD